MYSRTENPVVSVVYLRLCVALCCVRVVVHLIGEQGHEEREAADVSGARLSAVERLGGRTTEGVSLPTNQNVKLLHCAVLYTCSHKKGEMNRNKGIVLLI